MTPADEAHAMKVYLPRMDEIVGRIEVINVCTRNDPGFSLGFVREICYLQFRAICELIAIGCLAIYGDRRLSRKILETYEASKIINELQKLDPNCYPQPISFVRSDKHVAITGLPNATQLSRTDLVQLWGRSGDVLHRSPFNKATKANNPKDFDLSDIWHWSAKITGLLTTHAIVINSTEATTKLMTVALRDVDTKMPAANFLTLSFADGTAETSAHHFRRPKKPTP